MTSYPGSVNLTTMHEFSLADEVIKLAQYEAEKSGALSVREITIEVGSISGVDADAFESAIELLAEGSILENSRLNIVRISGKGICLACNREFEMNQRMDTCPVCRSFPSEIRGGRQFRIVSLLIEDE